MGKQARLVGLPGPTEKNLEQREAINAVLIALHNVIVPMLEELPVGEGTKSQISCALIVKGDLVSVKITSGETKD